MCVYSYVQFIVTSIVPSLPQSADTNAQLIVSDYPYIFQSLISSDLQFDLSADTCSHRSRGPL